MPVRLSKPWLPTSEIAAALKGQMGVFQLANASDEVLYIGYAGGKSLYGLKGEVTSQAEQLADATQFRFEVTTSYLSRYRELLMIHHADHGAYPIHNPPIKLGRLSAE